MNETIWIRPELKEFHINDIWYQGMRLFCSNLSNGYYNKTKKKLNDNDINLFLDTMRTILLEENKSMT